MQENSKQLRQQCKRMTNGNWKFKILQQNLITRNDSKTRSIHSFIVTNENGFYGFLKVIILRVTKTETLSLRAQKYKYICTLTFYMMYAKPDDGL